MILLYPLANVNPLQLSREIQAALSLTFPPEIFDKDSNLAVESPELTESHKIAVQGVIAKHVPNPLYGMTPEQINLKIYSTLKTWAADAAQVYTDWPTKTAGQKDAVNREVVNRIGKLCSGLADLLRFQGLN